MRDRRPHAVAWWIWAGLMAATAIKVTNPVVLVCLGAVVVSVGVLRHATASSGASLRIFVTLGLVIVAVRVAFQIVFGQRIPGHVLFTLPSVPLPSWAEGVSIGGPVTAEALITAGIAGARLGLIVLCFGVANVVANPRDVLRALPGVFNEVAVAITVALCFVPELAHGIRRVRTARKLRGRPATGIAGMRGLAVPVLEDALERSMDLAASMGARGFGRVRIVPSSRRSVLCGILAAGGILSLVVGIYGVLSQASPIHVGPELVLVGALLVTIGILGSGRRSSRTHYRPAPFGWRSLICASSGAAVLVGISILGALEPTATSYSPYPLSWPLVSPWAVALVAVGLVPLLVSPRVDVAVASSMQRPQVRAEVRA